jgi:glutamate 5-kinase
MKTKIMAARMAMDAGCAMAITLGSPVNPLNKLETGAPATWFVPQTDPQAARKRWIASMKPKGEITIDAGAARALSGGKSLLSVGVTAITGKFGRGDPVVIRATDGARLAQGLARYTATEADLIKGHSTADIEPILGYEGRGALVHRDDMVL